MHTLSVMGSSGHNTLTWDPKDPKGTAEAKEMFEHLQQKGYRFWATEGGQSTQIKTFAEANGSVSVDKEPAMVPPASASDCGGQASCGAKPATKEGKKKDIVAAAPLAGG